MNRFWNKVKKDKEDSCWIWQGSFRGEYGAFKYNKKVIGAHVASYIFTNGVFDKKYYVCHSCDNPKCVNPSHLFLGTHSDNMKDAYQKNRLKVPIGNRFKNGNIPINAKLDQQKVDTIKSLIEDRRSSGKPLKLKIIAKVLDVSYQTVRDISAGRAYK